MGQASFDVELKRIIRVIFCHQRWIDILIITIGSRIICPPIRFLPPPTVDLVLLLCNDLGLMVLPLLTSRGHHLMVGGIQPTIDGSSQMMSQGAVD